MMMRTRTLTLLSSTLFAFYAAACGEPKAPNDPTVTRAPVAQNPTGTGPFDHAVASTEGHPEAAGAGPKPNDSPTTATPPVELTDAQVLEVVRMANTGEIEQAKLAQTKAKDGRVKKFAAMMVKEHGEANAKGDALAKKNSIEPKASLVSTNLESDTKQATATMASRTGAEFDKAYMDAQVQEHQAVLDTIEVKLLPAAKSPDLKAMLADVRGHVSHHLTEAKTIQASLK